MDLILWRHAEAEARSARRRDLGARSRRKGERQAERMAEWLNRRLPHRRASSSARRCAASRPRKRSARKFKTVAALAPGSERRRAARGRAAGPMRSEPVLVVGHQPTLGLVARSLLAGTAQPWAVKKARSGGCATGRATKTAEVVLHAVQSPDVL